MSLDSKRQVPAAVRYQAINTLGFIISTQKSRSYITGFREELFKETCSMILNTSYEKYFDIVLRMFS
jgi:hypothetical protein